MNARNAPPIDLSTLLPTYVQTLERMSDLFDALDRSALADEMRARLLTEIDTCSINRAFANELMLWILTKSTLSRTVAITLDRHDTDTASAIRAELETLIEAYGEAWTLAALRLIRESALT